MMLSILMALTLRLECITEQLIFYKIDIEKNIIFIKGSVPGSKGALVYVNHTRKG